MKRTPSYRTIRASELGTYLYCRRAWWYQKKGEASLNQRELRAGTRMHEAHGRSVFVSGFFRTLGYVLILAALLLLTIQWTSGLF
jgi:hypothetical protein